MRHLVAFLSITIAGGWMNFARAEDDKRPLDQNFLIQAATCNNAVIEIGKLADKRAGSPKVKEFAESLVTDHKKCYDRLAEVLKNRKLAIVSGLEKDVRDEEQRLSNLSGADFDRAFLKWVIKTHKKAIANLENQVENGKDAEIRSFAKEGLPAVRDHLKRAEELAKTIN